MSFRQMTQWPIELLPWYAFIIVWIVAALRVKTTKAEEPLWSRLGYGSLMVAGFYLLFSEHSAVGLLGERFVRTSQWVATAGIVLTFAGVGVAIWARIILGENWSARVTRKIDHQLVKSGPYAFVRHPIYSGLLLATIGTAIFVGEWRGVLAIPLILASESIKARREEQFMAAEFGDDYEEYRRETGFLIPGW
ncbi:MAG TPA: isoprenylcysteine carboxylmethyltransferase family protein [Terriglobales bacterium]|nr:isoprenylcysteine carboxylmethyltransferase family protein [Terriglobales bacterium]